MLVKLIQQMYPQWYGSAGFIACLLCAAGVSATLYAITQYKGWLVCLGAAIIYLVPFWFYMR